MRHSPSCLVATSVWIESRPGDGSDLPRITVPPSACIRATSGLRNRTPSTFPTSRLPFEPLVEELLVKRGDLSAPFEVLPVETDQIAVLRKGRRVGGAAALVP